MKITTKLINLPSPINNVSTVRTLYAELLGDSEHPAIILNCGAGNQCITWPDGFCKKLVDLGYCVIRYDYRDCGLSSALEYENDPYTLLDLADDTIKILASFALSQAHYVGYSMGGQLAQIIGAYRPECALSLTLIGTSTTFKPGFDAFEGVIIPGTLSAPNSDYIAWATRSVDINQQTFDEKVNDFVHTAYLQDGKSPQFDRSFFEEFAKTVLTRSPLLTPYIQHAKAMQASYRLHNEAPAKIHTPTLIIQGESDPVFPPDHAESLHRAIASSELVIVRDFGHVLSPRHFDMLIEKMQNFLKNVSNECAETNCIR